MSRPLYKWLIFAACLAMFLAVMAWITTRALGMERQRVAAERDAQVQERIRLALWRMDSLASTLLIRENSRPPGDYQAFRSPDELFTRDNKEITKGKTLMPSPLLGEPPEFVLLHFEVASPAGSQIGVCSPQVPTGSQLELANNWYAISPQLKYATDRLARLDTMIKRHPDLLSRTHLKENEQVAPSEESKNKELPRPAPTAPKTVAKVFKAAPVPAQAPAANAAQTAMDVQIASNVREQNQRSNLVKQQIESEKLNASKVPMRKTGEGTLQLYGDSSRMLADNNAARSKKTVVGSKVASAASSTPTDGMTAPGAATIVANSSISSTATPVPMEKAKSDASHPMPAAKSLGHDLAKSGSAVVSAPPAPAAAVPATRSGYVASNETVKTESKPASPSTIVAAGGGAAAPGNVRADAPATLNPAAKSPMTSQVEIDPLAGLSRAREADKLASVEKREERQSAAAPPLAKQLEGANTYSGATVISGGTLTINGGISGAPTLQTTPSPPAETTTPGDLKPLWLEHELLLVRNASLDGKARVQGVWVDWEKLRGQLLGAVTDLLPNASLSPALAEAARLDPSALVTLPVKLTAGAIALPMTNGWSALQRALAIAWICLAIAAAATALVLHRAMLLSERRGAFVSAVTHELRTPLTTFQLYSEMLADDMVPDAAKRREYLRTLCDESTRLTHLVENVLAYSRIERGRTAARVERITVGDLIARIEPRLRRRCAEVALTLEVSLPSDIAARMMDVDAMGVEQILFNLADNACKYAEPKSAPRTLHLEVSTAGPRLAFRIRDHGPGISRQQQKRLFQPFEKSATDAAHSAPGVGLGLALCRRLAREMGGDLVLEKTESGACFALTLSLS